MPQINGIIGRRRQLPREEDAEDNHAVFLMLLQSRW